MIDLGFIVSAVSGLKTAGDMAKGLLDLKTAGDIQGKVIELQSVILNAQESALAAQSEQMTLLQRIDELEKRISRTEAWEAETSRYQLKDYGENHFAYELKNEFTNGEPMHRLCAACFQDGKKSILQYWGRDGFNPNRQIYKCSSCKTDFNL